MLSPLFRSLSLCRITLACGLAMLAIAVQAADDAAASAPPLTLQDCIDRALQKNFGLKIEGYTADNAVQNLTVSKATYDPSFTLSASKSVSQADVAATALVGTHTDSFDTRIGVNQKVSTGATVSVSSSLDRNASNNSYATLNPAYSADLSLSVRQPLLKGAGTTVNRAAIKKAELGVDIANLNYKGQMLQVVSDTESAYYDLVYAREQLKVREFSLELAQKLYEENHAKQQTGVATKLDVLQAQVGVATAQNNVLLAKKTVRDAEDALLNIIGEFEFGTALGEVSLPAYDGATTNFDQSYQQARDNQPDILVEENTIKQLEVDVAAAKRNRLPSLDLDGAVGYNTRDRNVGDALDRLPNGDGYAWQLGLSLTVPWGNRSDKASYHVAQNSLLREQVRLRQTEQRLMMQVRAAVRAVETNVESVNISAQATLLSEKQYELEKAKFDAGSSTSRKVLQAQDDLETARVSELQARVNLRKAISALHQLEGSSLGVYHIAPPNA